MSVSYKPGTSEELQIQISNYAKSHDGWVHAEFINTPKHQVKVEGSPNEESLLKNLPDAELYEKSYTHRDKITHVATINKLIITASIDGYVKVWKKVGNGIKIVAQIYNTFPIITLAINANGTYLCTSSIDRSVKIYDVMDLNKVNTIELNFEPNCLEWIYNPNDKEANALFAVSDAHSPKIVIYNAKRNNIQVEVFTNWHKKPVRFIKYNDHYDTNISMDRDGNYCFWSGQKGNFRFPKQMDSLLVASRYLDRLKEAKIFITDLVFSPNRQYFATLCSDRKVRLFTFRTVELTRIYDETLNQYQAKQKTEHALPNMDFERKMATEWELEKSESFQLANIQFDCSGQFILYPTMIGIKVVNIETNVCHKVIGAGDNVRPLHIALFQDQEALSDPISTPTNVDPTLFVTAYEESRFYMYSRRMPSDLKMRDVFNEKRNTEDLILETLGKILETLEKLDKMDNTLRRIESNTRSNQQIYCNLTFEAMVSFVCLLLLVLFVASFQFKLDWAPILVGIFLFLFILVYFVAFPWSIFRNFFRTFR